jgi:hypothetical protein
VAFENAQKARFIFLNELSFENAKNKTLSFSKIRQH